MSEDLGRRAIVGGADPIGHRVPIVGRRSLARALPERPASPTAQKVGQEVDPELCGYIAGSAV